MPGPSPITPGLVAPPTLPTRVIMLTGGLIVTIGLASITPVLPGIEHALARTPDEKLLVKMLVPVAAAAMVVGAPTIGFLVGRINLRVVAVTLALLFALAGTSGFYLNGLPALVASRLVVGFAASGLATLSITLVNTRLEPAARARWMGYHMSIAMFGSLLVYPLVGALGTLGWRWPFLVYAVGFVIALIAARAEMPALVAPAEGAEAARPGFRERIGWFPLWFLPLALVVGSVTYLPTVYLPFVAREVGVTSPATVSAIMLADAVIGATMALLFGWSRRQVSSGAAFLFSFACTGTGMLVASLAHDLVQLVIGMIIFGFGIGWFMPNLLTALSEYVSADRQGKAVGILKATHYLASPLAIAAVEPIARAFGPGGAMTASSVAALATAGIFLVLLRRPVASRPVAGRMVREVPEAT